MTISSDAVTYETELRPGTSGELYLPRETSSAPSGNCLGEEGKVIFYDGAGTGTDGLFICREISTSPDQSEWEVIGGYF